MSQPPPRAHCAFIRRLLEARKALLLHGTAHAPVAATTVCDRAALGNEFSHQVVNAEFNLEVMIGGYVDLWLRNFRDLQGAPQL
jgi:hypothetical protein